MGTSLLNVVFRRRAKQPCKLSPEAEIEQAVLEQIMDRGCASENSVARRTGFGLTDPEVLRVAFGNLQKSGRIRTRVCDEDCVPEMVMYELAL